MSQPDPFTPPPHEQRPGHHWKEPERVRAYVERMDARAAERGDQLRLLARLIPFPADAAIRVLDVGAGYGAVAAAVLDAFPNATAVLLDVSQPMMEVGRERMAPYAGRYAYVEGDFADGRLPDLPGRFHAVVSSLAIHHLPPAGKQTLYRDIAARLEPGGCFLNLDLVAAPSPQLEARYRAVAAAERGEPPPAPADRGHHTELQPLAQHLRWLHEAGLTDVDCFWKRLSMALVGGYAPGPAPGR